MNQITLPIPSGEPINVELHDSTHARLIAYSENTGRRFNELLLDGVRAGLPELEREILGEQFVDGTNPK